jgi:hypothetical protein
MSLQDLGITATDQPQTDYEKLILGIANDVTGQLREYTLKNARNSGALAASIAYFPTGVMSFEVQADDYYNFIDQGVNALPAKEGYRYKRPMVTSSPYSFRIDGVGGKMFDAIKKWKGFDVARTYATAYSIKRHGIAPRRITDHVINEELLNNIMQDLLDLTGLQFTVKFEKNTKSWD